jgi:sugar transferase (PEP-CTERM/EpsH1 system associated)
MNDRRHANVLYLVHRVPYPPDKGDRIRAFQLLRYLSRHADVHLACLADEPVEAHTLDVLRQYARRVSIVPLGRWSRWVRALGSLAAGRTVSDGAFRSPELRAVLREWVGDTRFDAAVASASSLVPYLRLPEFRSVPAVIDLVDVDSQKWLDYAEASRGPRAWLYRLEGRRLRRLEQTLPTWARAITLVTQAEVDLYRGFASGGVVRAVGNGVDLQYFQPQEQDTEPACVFVGALDYRPNVDGACWFCREVWPEIQRRRPDAKTYLVGRRPVPAVRRLAELPGIEVVGQVPDVRPYLARAAVVVAPLQIARGVQNKVLEALAMAKATVASPLALEGLTAEAGVHLLQASSGPGWVEAILRLLADPSLRQQLGTAGRRFVEAHHHWDRCLEPFRALLGLAASEGRAAAGERRQNPSGLPARNTPLATRHLGEGEAN